MKKTYIKRVKAIIKELLEIEPVRSTLIPGAFYHPIIKYGIIPDDNGQMIDLIENKETFQEYKKKYGDFLDKKYNTLDILDIINDPFKLAVLNMIRPYLSAEDLGTRLWIYIWQNKFMWSNPLVTDDEVVQMIQEADKCKLNKRDKRTNIEKNTDNLYVSKIREDNSSCGLSTDEILAEDIGINVYRGVPGCNSAGITSACWYAFIEMAYDEALGKGNNPNDTGFVYTGVIKRKDIITIVYEPFRKALIFVKPECVANVQLLEKITREEYINRMNILETNIL